MSLLAGLQSESVLGPAHLHATLVLALQVDLLAALRGSRLGILRGVTDCVDLSPPGGSPTSLESASRKDGRANSSLALSAPSDAEAASGGGGFPPK